jgi:hypothetical protein
MSIPITIISLIISYMRLNIFVLSHLKIHRNYSYLKELQGWKWREAWGKEGPATGSKWIQLKGRSQGSLLLRLWSTHKKGPNMTALWKTQQATESVWCRYLHQFNGWKQLTPVVELAKAEEAEEGTPVGGPAVSINLSSLKHQSANTSWYETPNTYIEEFLVCVHSEMMHLTCKRFRGARDFRGQVGQGWGGDITWREGGGEKVWGVEQLEGRWGWVGIKSGV